VSEGAAANIGFFEASGVVWPEAPLLHGITMQLLEHQLRALGVPTRRVPVRLHDLPSFEGAFLSSARGVAAVAGIDDVRFTVHEERVAALVDAYDSVPWDEI
jgi:branched-subunit amino acid aminotransferase/4-amino-4-deoxychorismate lyase